MTDPMKSVSFDAWTTAAAGILERRLDIVDEANRIIASRYPAALAPKVAA